MVISQYNLLKRGTFLLGLIMCFTIIHLLAFIVFWLKKVRRLLEKVTEVMFRSTTNGCYIKIIFLLKKTNNKVNTQVRNVTALSVSIVCCIQWFYLFWFGSTQVICKIDVNSLVVNQISSIQSLAQNLDSEVAVNKLRWLLSQLWLLFGLFPDSLHLFQTHTQKNGYCCIIDF